MQSGDLDRAEAVLNEDLLGSATDLIQVLKKDWLLDSASLSSIDGEALKKRCQEETLDLERKIDEASGRYFQSLDCVTRILLEKILRIKKPLAINLSNFKLRKRLEVLTEQEELLKKFAQLPK